MAKHTLTDLLNVAAHHDAKIHGGFVKINKAIQQAGAVEAIPGIPASELKFDMDDDDPFNGNRNNRRVAARIAADHRTIHYLNNSMPTHIGDPKKAEADVAKSLAVDPDPVVLGDDAVVELPHIALTPGSPAAKKAAEAAAKGDDKPVTAPPVWKANA